MIKKHQGFTIVELLVVIGVIAILSFISVSAINGLSDRANAAKAASVVKQYVQLLEMYRTDNGRYPSSTSPEYPSQPTTCLGRSTDFPATTTPVPAELCFMATYNFAYQFSYSSSLITSLSAYGTAPDGRLSKQFLFDSEYWRGATYYVGATQTSPFYFNGAPFQTVIIDWKAKDNGPKLCMLPGWEFTPSSSDGFAHCEIYRRMSIG